MLLVTIVTVVSVTNARDNNTECHSTETYRCGHDYRESRENNYVKISECAQCKCGDDTLSYEDYKENWKRCCPAPGGECEVDDDGDGVCNKGVVIDRSRNQRCNDYTHFYCDNKTVNKYNICHGSGLCQDGTDLEQCSTLSCGSGQTSCEDGQDVSSTAHRECYLTRKGNDGEFDCLNRRDEKVVIQETSVKIDFKELKKCEYRFGYDTLLCGSDCRWNFGWCRSEYKQSCETNTSSYNTVSQEICSNATIWRNISCDVSDHTKGVRCSGYNQQCIFPHYTTTETNFPDTFRRCEDKSDQVFPANKTCNDIALDHHKSYCDTFCTPGQEYQPEWKSRDPKCSEKCGDPSSWLSKQTDPYIQDPHLCQDSCQTPDRHCEACSNEKYPRCLRNNVTVCYHMDLWCDGHPVCDGAEDEPIRNVTCYQKLLKRGKC